MQPHTHLPTLDDGRISWIAIANTLKPGAVLILPRKYRNQASSQLARYGIHCRTRRHEAGVRVEILGVAPVSKEAATAETFATLHRKITDARENLGYWRRQKLIRENHLAKVEAGARVLLWESQLKTLQSKLADLQPAAV